MHTGIDLILELRKRVIAFHILAGFQRGERKRGETKVDFDFFLFSEKQKEDSIWFKLQANTWWASAMVNWSSDHTPVPFSLHIID